MRLEKVIAGMEDRRRHIPRDDPRRYFHDTYLRTTIAIAGVLDSDVFVDPDWVERWDEAFALYYLEALDHQLEGTEPPGPWQVALTAGRDHRLAPLRMVLLGMNAHINFDLPQAIVQVISDEEFDDPDLLAQRETDHRIIDDILASRVADEDVTLEHLERPGDRTLMDRLLRPLKRRGTKRFLRESRHKVWHNALILAHARRDGSYEAEVERLADLARQRVADLVRPGPIILELARNGFGVELD
jgi:hypothetical protein